MEDIAIKVAEHTEQLKVANHRIADLETKTDRIESLTMSVQKLAFSIEHMAKEQADYRSKQNELAKKLLEIEQAPAKAKAKVHDDVMGLIVHTILTAFVTGVLVYLGLS